jgi:putative ABC transport system permease protein
MRSLLTDVRFALRLLRRSPAFYGTLLAVIVVGIGATTAIFSIMESLVLRPLPFPHPGELTMVWRDDPVIHEGPTSVPDYLDWKARASTFQQMAAIDYASFSLSSEGGAPEFVPGAYVSGDFFPMFGLQPLRGRLLGTDDDHVGGAPVAVISASLWHRRFASDPAILGKTVMLSSQPYTVVGVAAEGFHVSGPWSNSCDVWTPIQVSLADWGKLATSGRGEHFMNVIGRRQAGVSLGQAQAQMTEISNDLSARFPDTNAKRGVRVEDLQDALVWRARSLVWLLFAAVGLVFAIVCSNVANLLLTRAQGRRAEMAARAALGATPARLARQIVTETVVVFLLGSLGGWLGARWLDDVFATGILSTARAGAGTIDIRVDSMALLFSVVACLDCGVVFGLVPALAVARVEPQTVLKESAARAGVGRTQRAVRGGLVVGQVALACALLVGSALSLRSFAQVASTPPGFDPNDLATARIVLPEAKYADDAKVQAFYRDVLAKMAARPDVRSVAADSTLPMGGSNNSSSFEIEGHAPFAKGDEPVLERNVVVPGYFATMGIPLLRGRDLAESDREGGRRVMVISASTAARYFAGQDPIGQRIDLGEEDGAPKDWREIVGVVGDVRRRGLGDPVADESYVPLAQETNRWMMVIARTPHPEALLADLPGIVASIDPQQAVSNRQPMTARVADLISGQRSVAMMLTMFASAALVLSCLGVFGLVSYSTQQRQREIGIRMALGSTPGKAIGLVMKGGMALLGAGLAIGMIAAVFVGRVLAQHLPVSPFDPSVYVAIAAVLGLSGAAACLIPAWRAVRVPPASALRYE